MGAGSIAAARQAGRRTGWLVAVGLLLAGCASPPAAPLRDGGLDLRGGVPPGVFALEGTWRARAGADSSAFAAFDYRDDHWRPVALPALFTAQGFPDEGVVWYRLHLRLPPGAPRLRGFLSYAGNATALYAARPGRPPELLGRSGVPAATAGATVLSRAPFSFTLPADTALVLSWKVANHGYRFGGPFYRLLVGPEPALHRLLFRQYATVLVFVGVYAMLFVYFLLYWLWYPKDPANLAIALVAFVMALRVSCVEGYFEYLFPTLVDFRARVFLEAATFFAIPGVLLFALWAIYPQEFAPLGRGRAGEPAPGAARPAGGPAGQPAERPAATLRLRRYNSVVALLTVASSLGFIALAFFASARQLSDLIFTYRLVALGLIGASVLLLVQVAVRRRAMAGGVVGGYGVLFAAGIRDLLVGQGYLPGEAYLTPYAFVVFMLVQSFVVARRNARNAAFVRNYADLLEDEVQRRTEALREASVAAQAASVAKSRFLSTVSHEIRTPIASMISFAQTLEEDLAARLQAPEREALQVIATNGRRLLDLVNDLLDLAKAESGHLDLRLSAVAADAVADDVVRQLHVLARRKGLSLALDRRGEGLVVRADEARLRQVLVNLVSNAIKYTEEGTITLSVGGGELVDAEGPAPAVVFGIRDTGMGISPEFMPRLFERFTQEGRAMRQPGTGLGLALTRELVDRMGGRITVQSEIGAGSLFVVTLPQAAARPAAERAQA